MGGGLRNLGLPKVSPAVWTAHLEMNGIEEQKMVGHAQALARLSRVTNPQSEKANSLLLSCRDTNQSTVVAVTETARFRSIILILLHPIATE